MGEECGHQFCIYCWRDYLHKEVKLKHTVILCPGKDCSKVLDELTVIGYLDDEETKASRAKNEKKREGEGKKRCFSFLTFLKKGPVSRDAGSVVCGRQPAGAVVSGSALHQRHRTARGSGEQERGRHLQLRNDVLFSLWR